MVGVAPDEGSKRRLPSWMLGVTAAAQVQNSGNGAENNNHKEKGVASQPCRSKGKSTTTQTEKVVLLDGKETPGVNSCSLVKCETKRRSRKILNQQEKETDINIPKVVKEKRRYNGVGRKVGESAPRKKHKAKSVDSGSSEDIENPSFSDDDRELTVEDLLSIAKEYVEADINTMELQSSNRDHESAKKLQSTTSCEKESKGSVNMRNCFQKSSTHPTIASSSSTANLTSDQSLLSASKTGDPAQDMLDLFLGPWLKKPLQEEKKTEFTANDMEFSYEFRKPSQKTQNDVEEEMVPRMKTKSSLKDKVAMLLS